MSYPNNNDAAAVTDSSLTPSTESTMASNRVPDGSARSVDRIQLSDGYSVSPEFLNAIRLHIEGRLPELQRDRRYKARDLFGEDSWEPMYDGERRMVGRCLAYLVARGELPLVFVPGKHEYPLHYELS